MNEKFFEHLKQAVSYISNSEFVAAYQELKLAFSYYDKTSDQPNQIFYEDVLDLTGHMALKSNYPLEAQYYFEQELILNIASSNARNGLEQVSIMLKKYSNTKNMLEWSLKNLPSNQFVLNDLNKVNQILGNKVYQNSLLA